MTQLPRGIDHGPAYIANPPEIPAELERWVRPIGVEAAVALLLACGGAPVYLADNPSNRNQIAALIGIESARALAEELGRGSLRVPTGKRWLAQHYKAPGWTTADIARKLHVTDVTVRSYLKLRTENPQVRLL